MENCGSEKNPIWMILGTNVSVEDQHTFIHELGHVWQHLHGQWVRMRGLFSWAADYYYKPDKERLKDYSHEKQASIIADYCLIFVYGIDKCIAFLHFILIY